MICSTEQEISLTMKVQLTKAFGSKVNRSIKLVSTRTLRLKFNGKLTYIRLKNSIEFQQNILTISRESKKYKLNKHTSISNKLRIQISLLILRVCRDQSVKVKSYSDICKTSPSPSSTNLPLCASQDSNNSLADCCKTQSNRQLNQCKH